MRQLLEDWSDEPLERFLCIVFVLSLLGGIVIGLIGKSVLAGWLFNVWAASFGATIIVGALTSQSPWNARWALPPICAAGGLFLMWSDKDWATPSIHLSSWQMGAALMGFSALVLGSRIVVFVMRTIGSVRLLKQSDANSP